MSINQTKIEPAVQLLNEVGVFASLRFQEQTPTRKITQCNRVVQSVRFVGAVAMELEKLVMRNTQGAPGT